MLHPLNCVALHMVGVHKCANQPDRLFSHLYKLHVVQFHKHSNFSLHTLRMQGLFLNKKHLFCIYLRRTTINFGEAGLFRLFVVTSVLRNFGSLSPKFPPSPQAPGPKYPKYHPQNQEHLHLVSKKLTQHNKE